MTKEQKFLEWLNVQQETYFRLRDEAIKAKDSDDIHFYNSLAFEVLRTSHTFSKIFFGNLGQTEVTNETSRLNRQATTIPQDDDESNNASTNAETEGLAVPDEHEAQERTGKEVIGVE